MHGPRFRTGSDYGNIDQEGDVWRVGWKGPSLVPRKVGAGKRNAWVIFSSSEQKHVPAG